MPNLDPNELSERELEILKLVATGASNKEIAHRLVISANTVKVHLRNIFAKIGVTSRTEAAMYAVNNRLVLPQGVVEVIPGLSGDNGSPDLFSLTAEAASESTPENKKALSWWGVALGVLVVLGLIGIAGILWARQDSSQAAVPTPGPDAPVQWQELTPLLTARSELACASFEDALYAIGGETIEGVTGAMDRYDIKSNSWTSLTPKPLPVTDANAAVISGLIYVPGGRLETGKPTEVVEVYDIRQDRWSQAASLPTALSAYSLSSLEGKLYLFGGWDGERFSNQVFIYDPSLDSWVEGTPMPTIRGYAGASVSNSEIYVIGGTDGNTTFSRVDIYLPTLEGSSQSPWIQGVPLPTGRQRMGLVSIADIIHVLGGINGSPEALPALTYFPLRGEWQQFEAPFTQSWSGLGLVPLGTNLYALGGEVGDALSDRALAYQAIYTISLPITK